MIPITVVQFGEEEEKSVLEVLRSGRLAQGPKVEEFERRFADLIGVKHAIAVNNGTTSLVASLQLLDLVPGDEVITSPFTFIATLNAILEAGAVATFADISADDFNLDPMSVHAAVTDRTAAIMPVHLYGQMADMPAISAIAAKRGLALVEDAAQAHGARIGDRSAGSYGLGSFSFYATKNLTTGEGGVITTNDDHLADRARVLRNQGMRARYSYEMAGHNYRMTDLQAAIVIPQLRRYEQLVSTRQSNAAALSEGLAGIPGIVTPQALPGRHHVWHQYTIRVTAEAGVHRDQLADKLSDAGVATGIYYPRLVTDYPPYQSRDDVRISSTPVAARVAQEVLSLPVHQHLSNADIDTIVDSVRVAVGAA